MPDLYSNDGKNWEAGAEHPKMIDALSIRPYSKRCMIAKSA